MKEVFHRIFTIGTCEDTVDLTLFVFLISCPIILIVNICLFLLIILCSKDIEGLQACYIQIGIVLFLHAIISSIIITSIIIKVYKKVIYDPIITLRQELTKMTKIENSEYVTQGKISNPFRDTNAPISWKDQVKAYVDTASAEKYVDELTGCFNKKYYLNKLSPMMETIRLASIENSNKVNTYDTDVYAVFMIDIDHFKWVNDDFGHSVGDQLLREVGKLLKEIVGDNGVVVRNGGEEFVVVSQNKYPYDFTILAREINEAFYNRIKAFSPTDGSYRRVTCSIGFVSYPIFSFGHDGSVISLEHHVEMADMAMYISKTHGRNRFHEIKSNKNPSGKYDMSKLTSDITYGLKRGLFVIKNIDGEFDELAKIPVEEEATSKNT